MPFPYIFTFYSYKGGVGRSMALMNVAYALVGRGRHVLIVDMDLEAPGVSGFLQRTEEFAPPQSAHPKDILTLLGEAMRVKADGAPLKEQAKNIPPLSHYIRSVAEEKLESLKPQLGKLGRLDVLGTDLERNYNERLAHLGIRNLPHDRLLTLSSVLHHYFKQQVFPFRPLGVEDFEPPIETPYDYVLIDSRTGVTEIGGLCIGPLADRLVVLTGLNDQNVEGTLAFMKEAGIEPRARTEKDEPWDDADTIADNPTLGPKPTILVATPVPTGEITFKQQRLAHLQQRLGIRALSISYHPQQALMETNFVRDLPEEFLAHEYRTLTTTVMTQAEDDAARLTAACERLREAKDFAKATTNALRLASDNPSLGNFVLARLADESLWPDDIHAGDGVVTRMFATLSQNTPSKPFALNHWGATLYYRAKTKKGEEADYLFGQARRKYAEALLLKPDHGEALNNWGLTLSDQANTKDGAEADRLFEEADLKFAEALRLRPDYAAAHYNRGYSLHCRARTKTGDEADRLVKGASREYAEAVRLKSDYSDALTNWGLVLSDQARTRAGTEADALLEEADRKFAEALRLKRDDPVLLLNWANALFQRAKISEPGDAARLLEEASRKYAEALRIKPDLRVALSNWALALSNQAKTKQGDQALHLRQQAAQKFLEVARLDVKQSNTPDALQAIQTAISLDPTITKSQLAADPLLNRPEFLSLPEN